MDWVLAKVKDAVCFSWTVDCIQGFLWKNGAENDIICVKVLGNMCVQLQILEGGIRYEETTIIFIGAGNGNQ